MAAILWELSQRHVVSQRIVVADSGDGTIRVVAYNAVTWS